jgi:hypothetical protein
VSTDRRTLVVVLLALVVAVPAAALRAMCVGRSCRRAEPAQARIPFCSLPGDVRDLLAAGFRDGRGPHVMAVAGSTPVRGGTALGALSAPWPPVDPGEEGVVPLVFAGAGVRPGALIPEGTTLDAVAPTVAQAIGLDRRHPGVRSGEAIAGVADPSSRPRLVVLVAWKGVGSVDLEAAPVAWPTLRGIVEDHAGTLGAEVGSLPLDPAATLTTIGTGGLPDDHGITGTLVRNDRGQVVRAWDDGAPFSVIAALGDDLDERLGQRPRIGAVLTDVADRGVIGGNWYVEVDRDDVVIARDDPIAQARRAEQLLAEGYGSDDTPDLLAVVMAGPVRAMDRALARVVTAAEETAGGRALVVVTATGSEAGPGAVPAAAVEADVEDEVGRDVIEATAPGGLFLDQNVLASTGLSEDPVVEALRGLRAPGGTPLLADVFPQVAVTFARYC